MKSITIREIHLHVVALPLVELLKTSFGAEPYKCAILVEAVDSDGRVGWGETALKTKPSYGAETILTALHVTRDFLIPKLLGATVDSPTQLPELFKSVRGNHHARAGVEAAIWDLMAKANEMRLADYFAAHLPPGNAPRESATVGVSIGIQDSLDEQIALIQKRLDEGYQRVKLKIAPGLGRRIGARRSSAVSRYHADARCQQRLHPGRCRASACARSVRPADD